METFLRVSSFFCLFSVLFASPISQYTWETVQDGEGRMHLVDVNEFDVEEIENFYNPETDIIFNLCTLRNPTTCQQVFWDDMDSIRNSPFDPSRPTQFTVHGWGSSGADGINWRTNQEFFRLGDYNMIGVDWSAGAQTNNYITARNRVGPTAAVVARFIDNLHSIGFLRFEETHVIGHSLGGHVVGLTGKAVTRGRIRYIVGLDPAGPLFNLSEPSNRIDASDGDFVEVIHTNYGQLGFREPVGQLDHYPNFGRSQPGCEGNDLTGSCSHSRAVFFFVESINSVFTATECTSFDEVANNQCTPTGRTVRMGGPVAKLGESGIFFVATNAQSPFSQG